MTGAPGVLFDVDGTLVDTPYLHAVTWAEALRQHGQPVPMATVHRAIGMGGDRLLDHLLGDDRDSSDDDELKAAHLALYKQYWGRLEPLPGARELLRTCARIGLRVVLASSASEEELSALRSALDVDDAIDAATSSADASSSKPAPDILEAAFDQGDVEPESAVFVGDSVWDGQSAAKAGVRFVGLTCGGTSEAELLENGAIEIWRDPADLLAHITDSVLGSVRVPAG
ncbi:MAG TPA: HAD family hydrolase [Jatrophihabitantaceae bacterium]|nr:HAD family hydrolase [Jatrophihabitantaceae bacterium]